jgi:TQXA domain-containing protein
MTTQLVLKPTDTHSAVTVVDFTAPAPQPIKPVTALSRVRGGTYSPTVEVIRFADGTTARTDLIRLNPNIDAYSLDFGGISPRQLSHYREVPWHEIHNQHSNRQAQITQVLANSFPHLGTTELTGHLREAGYQLPPGSIREHEAIAGTQAAIWRLSNGLELDTELLDAPIAGRARIGEHPSSRPVSLDPERGLEWHSQLPAGETAYLEIEFEDAAQLGAFEFTPEAHGGQHELSISLESSTNGRIWRPIPATQVHPGRAGRAVGRRLGFAATISESNPATGTQGHRFYRLAATGAADRDGLIRLRGVRLIPTGRPRFRNADRIVFLYDYLLTKATRRPSRVARTAVEPSATPDVGPFTLSAAAASISVADAVVVDADGYRLAGRIAAGQHFFLRRFHSSARQIQLQLRHHSAHARVLVGSRTPGGEAVFTTLVTLAERSAATHNQRFLTP